MKSFEKNEGAAEYSGRNTSQPSLYLRSRLRAAGRPFVANANISEVLEPGDLEALEAEVRDRAEDLLRALVIDVDSDHNTRETARRMAKLFVREVFAGRFTPAPAATSFPNVTGADEVCVVGPIDVRSACSHHFCPIEGRAWFGFIPGERLIGISKFSRIAGWVFARPQIQEEAAMQLADELERIMQPKALAVVIKARHSCMTWRGVKESESVMTSSVMRGAFRDKPEARAEVMSLIQARGYECR